MRYKYLIAVALLLLIALIAATWFALSGQAVHPTDESLVSGFEQHRDAFDTLAASAQRDSDLMTVSRSYVMLKDYRIWEGIDDEWFTQQRLAGYRHLFAELGSGKVDSFTKDLDIIYISASVLVKNLDNSESIVIEKGYACAPRELSPRSESLDGLGFESRGTYYRKIVDHWYLYHTWGVSKPE